MIDRFLYDAYHESGHCIVAMLFDDELDIRKVTINKKTVQAVNPAYNGGLDFGWKKEPLDTDYNAVDKIALISLAGICSTTIYTKGLKDVEENLNKFPYDSSQLSSFGADEDYKIAKQHINPLAECFYLKPIDVQWNMFFWLFRFFMKHEVWNCVIRMSESLTEKDDKTLFYKEIVELFDRIEFNKFLDINRNLILSRYPLNRNKLKLSV